MARNNLPAIDPATDALIVSVKLASGHFESSISLPVKDATTERMEMFVSQWLDLIQTGLRVGATSMSTIMADRAGASDA